MAKGLITKIIVSVLTILVLVLGYKIVLSPRDGKITMTSTEIKNSFKEIGQLAVEEYNFTNVGKFSQDNMSAFGISIPFTSSEQFISKVSIVLFLIENDGYNGII